MKLLRACDCWAVYCQHNPHPEYERARDRLEELRKKPWWKRIFLFEAMLYLKADMETYHWNNKGNK